MKETTQAELDAFKAEQTMDWTGWICFALTAINTFLFRMGWINLVGFCIGCGITAALYFTIKAAVARTKKKTGSYFKILAWTLLWSMCFQILILGFVLAFANLFNLEYRHPLFILAYKTVAGLIWLVLSVRWFANSFQWQTKTGVLNQIKYNGELPDSGKSIGAGFMGVPNYIPDKTLIEVVPVEARKIQLTHMDVKKALGRGDDKEDGIAILAGGTEPMIIEGSFTFEVIDTTANLLAKDPEKQLPMIIFEVLQQLLNRAAVADKDAVRGIQLLRDSLEEDAKDLLDKAALVFGFDCTGCTMTLRKPLREIRAIIEGHAELTKIENYMRAFDRMKKDLGETTAKLMAAAIMGDMEMEATRITVDDSPDGNGKGKGNQKNRNGRDGSTIAERMMAAAMYREGAEGHEKTHGHEGHGKDGDCS